MKLKWVQIWRNCDWQYTTYKEVFWENSVFDCFKALSQFSVIFSFSLVAEYKNKQNIKRQKNANYIYALLTGVPFLYPLKTINKMK